MTSARSPCLKSPDSCLSSLRFAIRIYADSSSTPIALRSQRAAANSVVPVPMTGSKTVSHVNENILTKLYANCSGYGAGCSLVDSPGIVQIC